MSLSKTHMESNIVTIVDENDNVLEYANKIEAHNKNSILHRGLSIFLITKKGEIVFQQRSKFKATWPLYWSNTVCGHPGRDESYINAARRHLAYEIGLKDVNLIYMGKYRYKAQLGEFYEHEICHVFVGMIDEKDISIKHANPKEVQNLALCSLIHLRQILSPKLNGSLYSGSVRIIDEKRFLNIEFKDCAAQTNTLISINNNESQLTTINIEQVTPWCIMGFYISKLCFYKLIDKIQISSSVYHFESIDQFFSNLNVLNEVINKISSLKFSYDSRLITSDQVFIALRGKSDGHTYIKDAINKGVRYFVLEYLPDKLDFGVDNLVIIYTDNTYEFLLEFAKYKRTLLNHNTFIGITGSVGKTSLKNFFADCLNAQTTYKNQNNHLGLPINLINLDDKPLNALELGMNHSGEIRLLTYILKPDYAIITNISEAHIQNLGSLLEIAKAKSEIFEGLSNCKVALFPIKDLNILFPIAKKYASEILTFGIQNSMNLSENTEMLNTSNMGPHNIDQRIDNSAKNYSECYIKEFEIFLYKDNLNDHKIRNNPSLSNHESICTKQAKMQTIDIYNIINNIRIRAVVSIFDNDLSIECQYMPRHTLETLLPGIIFCTKTQNVSNFSELLSKYKLDDGRGNIVYTKNFFGSESLIFNDAYNASPISMRSSIENLLLYYNAIKHSVNINKVLILGDMLELGSISKDMHIKILEGKEKEFDIIILCGKHMKDLYIHLNNLLISKFNTSSESEANKINIFHFDNYDDLLFQLRASAEILKCTDKLNLVLIKSSNGIKLHKLLSDAINLSTDTKSSQINSKNLE